ncbi:hypothetical protein RchiOBHm_Chr6g0267401 [Rosa chinensis]|uniref:DUF247 domain protein n=1 Tax=Rosa chinensis TaxID=74649 RepID=A0A2P6PPX9_ROSCH|nr:UPF0481 protein At3g47200 [Rosa chinensis]PRQ23984.1 hypothetical protein RchiOBHm_Chr6g0267401 [Rosa chinensis]
MEGINYRAANDIENPYSELETSILEELDSLSSLSPSRCIYRVPDALRRVREKAYTPRVVSIGPLHHGNEAFKAMEEHKKRYLKHFIGRRNLSLKDYIRKIKDQETKLRSCYAETVDFKSDEFVRIILVDAIFIIEFLYRSWYPNLVDENDCIFGKARLIQGVWPDLLMLENQLPFFILEDLFDPRDFPVPSPSKVSTGNIDRLSIIFLSHWFLNEYAIQMEEREDQLKKICSSKVQVQHFLDLLRALYIGPAELVLKRQQVEKPKTVTAPNITELHRAGIKFKEGSTTDLLDIHFIGGILEIPKLKVWDDTEIIFRNLVAFELCNDLEYYISDYVSIIDSFVNTSEDVELLVKYGLVENMLGDNSQLSTMINSLAAGVELIPSEFYYASLCEDLSKYCSSKWHRSRANLKQNYFNTPWRTTSVIAAAVLLILTFIQTVCSALSIA